MALEFKNGVMSQLQAIRFKQNLSESHLVNLKKLNTSFGFSW